MPTLNCNARPTTCACWTPTPEACSQPLSSAPMEPSSNNKSSTVIGGKLQKFKIKNFTGGSAGAAQHRMSIQSIHSPDPPPYLEFFVTQYLPFNRCPLNFFHMFYTLKLNPLKRASLQSSDYYWPQPEPVALRATGQVSTLTAHLFYPSL